jgi:hypothetical protein
MALNGFAFFERPGHLLVHGALRCAGYCVGQHTFQLGFRRSRIDVVFSRQQSIYALPGYVAGLTF